MSGRRRGWRRLVGARFVINGLDVAASVTGGQIPVGIIVRATAVRSIAVRSMAVRSGIALTAGVVVDGAAVAAGFAPAVAVGGVTVVQERLGPLDGGGDAELVEGARVAVGFTRSGPHVGGGPDRVELLAGHPGEQ